MKAQALPDAFQVYLHCHTIFDGQSAQIRNLKKVTQILLQNKKSLAGLTIAFTIPDIASVATQLLKDRIFESQHLAIQRFPKLLTPLTPKDTEPAPAQIESSKSEANAGQGEAQDSGNGKRKGSKGQDDKSADLDVEQGLDSKGCEDAYNSASDPWSVFQHFPLEHRRTTNTLEVSNNMLYQSWTRSIFLSRRSMFC